MLSQYLFYFLSFLAVISALLVVFSKSSVQSVLWLIVTLFAISGHYIFLLNAEFLGVVQVIVYAGAIMVLFLFVIMFLNLNQEVEAHKPAVLKFAATISSGLLLIIIIGSLKGSEQLGTHVGSNDFSSIKNLGRVLFKEFLFPFEVSSVLLLIAMVGAVMLGKSEKEG